MKTRIRALLLAAMFVVSLLPVMSFAAAERVDNATDLKTKLEAGTSVVLTASINLDQVITIGSDKNVTLTAESGVIITASATDVFTVTSGGTLTLGNNIKVVSTSSILWANGGTINVAGAVLENTSNAAHVMVFAENGGIINLTAGEINGKNAHTTIDVTGSGSALNISGTGKATSAVESVICARNNAVATISGGTVETAATVPMSANDAPHAAAFSHDGGKIVVTGGTVKAAGGRAVVTAEAGGGKVEISGGTLIGGESGAVYMAPDSTEFTITGGTFSHAPTDIEGADGYSIIPPPVYGGPVMNWVKVNAAENGVVKSGPLAASAGATITLYPKASTGYVLDTVEVLDAEGNAVALDGMKFQVPLGGVTVNATFKLAE